MSCRQLLQLQEFNRSRRCKRVTNWRTHEFLEDQRIVEVWIPVGVFDDVRLDLGFSERYLDTRRFDSEKFEVGHVADAPTHNLHTERSNYTSKYL